MAAGGSNSSNETLLDLSAYDNAAAVIYFLLFIFIVPLNILVIIILLKSETRKSRLHFFLLHLAIADLSVGVISVLGEGIISSLEGAWYGGDVLCRIYRYLKGVTIVVSNDLLIGLSIDRFLAIAFPMMVMKKGSILYKTLVAGSWLVALVVSIFYLIFSKDVIIYQVNECFIDLPEDWWKPYAVVVSLFVYILPTIVICLCYVGITIVVWKKWKENLHLSELSKPGHTDDKTKPMDTSQVFLSKAKVKSIKMTLVICLAFFVCWTPYFVTLIMMVFDKSIHPGTYTIVGTLNYFNSLCNPLVFMLFNKDKFLPKQMCGKKNGNDTPEEVLTLESNE